MSPEQEVPPQLLSMRDIIKLAGFDPNNNKDSAVAHQRIHDFIERERERERDGTITTYILGKKHFFLLADAEKIARGITGPIRRTSDTLADGTEDQTPQKHGFNNTLSQPELKEISNREREANRLKKQAQEKRKKEAEIVKQQMPIYFTNEVLAYVVENKLNALNLSLYVLLNYALKKVNPGNGKITLAVILDGQSEEDTQRYFIQEFNFLLQRGFNNPNTQNHQSLSQEEKKLIEQCDCLKNQKSSKERVLKEVCTHFEIPPSYILLGT